MLGIQGWRRYICESNVVDHNISFYGTLETFDKSAAMGPEVKAMFSNSCFGQFLDVPKVTRSSKIINHLLMRVGYFVGEEEREDTLFIELGGEPRAFTREDFCSILGLRHGDVPALDYTEPAEGGLFSELFSKGTTNSRVVLTTKLVESQGWPHEKRVKLLLLHFLFNVLLGAPLGTTIRDWSYVKLVEDLDQFNSYPWGNVVWKFFVENCRKYVKNVEKKDSKAKINLPSFMYPLQIWAYETMPVFSTLLYCERLSDTDVPLMRRWKSTTHVVDNTFSTISWQSENFVFKPMGGEEVSLKTMKKASQPKLKQKVID